MTEAEWLAGTDPEKMLAFMLAEEPLWPLRLLRLFARQRKLPTTRKLGLFLCAFFRRASQLLGYDEDARVLVAENIADGEGIADRSREAFFHAFSGRLAHFPPWPTLVHTVRMLIFDSHSGRPGIRAFFTNADEAALARFSATEQGKLVGHVFGNPFRPSPTVANWPTLVVDLAKAHYAAQDRAPILADALEEAGHADLAEHMRSEATHPKGCCVLDLILGKS
jgi:hypothetical protein